MYNVSDPLTLILCAAGTIKYYSSSSLSVTDTTMNRCYRERGLRTVSTSHEDVPLCAALVEQHGTAAPVSMLHTATSATTRHQQTTLNQKRVDDDKYSVSKLWSKIVKKFRRDTLDHQRDDLYPRPNQDSIVTSNLLLHRSSNNPNEDTLPSSQNNSQDPSFKLLRTYMRERQVDNINPTETSFELSNEPPSPQSSSRSCGDGVNKKVAASSASAEKDGDSANTHDVWQQHDDIVIVVADGGGERRDTTTTTQQQQSPLTNTTIDRSQWCNTLPARRVKGDRRRTSRPVSLEIKVSPEDSGSPLSNYLSSSCNFKAPEEVVLSKSRTRVKTPRHPPLPRLSLNAPTTQFCST